MHGASYVNKAIISRCESRLKPSIFGQVKNTILDSKDKKLNYKTLTEIVTVLQTIKTVKTCILRKFIKNKRMFLKGIS